MTRGAGREVREVAREGGSVMGRRRKDFGYDQADQIALMAVLDAAWERWIALVNVFSIRHTRIFIMNSNYT